MELNWLMNFIRVTLSPIYDDLVAIVIEVSNANLKDDKARKAVFQKITDKIQEKGLDISDSLLNLYIEIAYQLVKKGKA